MDLLVGAFCIEKVGGIITVYDNCFYIVYDVADRYILTYNNNNIIITTPTLFSQSPSFVHLI